MFQVAICEDEKIIAETQEKRCREIMDGMKIEYGITLFASAEEYLNAHLQDGKRFDILLLDIIMDGMNGMELARKIRETDTDTSIAFLTSSTDYALMGYKVAASRYIQKGKEKKEIEELINEVYENKYSPSYFTFIAGAHTYRLRIKDIVAMETVERKVEITTTDGLFYFSGTLTELLGELPANYFTKCHQAFAVNMNQMREIERLDLIASNGKRIPISRPYLNDVKSAFMKRVKNI